jgi:hypothetical protein
MRGRALASELGLAYGLLVSSCDGDSSRAPKPAALPSPDTVPIGVHSPRELDEAAKQVIGFLRGEVGFDRIRVADRVTLYLSPEAGSARKEVTRESLRDPSNWSIRTADTRYAQGMMYSFVPTKGPAELTTRVGRHFNCREYPLSSRFAELARLPHVGTRLMYGTNSCLQTRNLTLVFDPNQKPPTLVAAVYDQWEW